MARTAIATLNARGAELASTVEQVRLLDGGRFKPFADSLRAGGLDPLTAVGIEVFQVNVGKLCNQTCRHCHVDAGPDRTEVMTRETFELCLEALGQTQIPTVDITGGAPELNPHFRWFVTEVKKLGRHVMDRSNLTILTVRSQADLADFLAEHEVEVVASLPSYNQSQTDSQRGEGIYEKSIAALKMLNARGYGREASGLTLNLVYNPVGAFLPGSQEAMERQFKRELDRRHGIVFNNLFAITNLPIGRFLEYLIESDNYETYMHKLIDAYNPVAAAGVMCRSMLSVGWDGSLYDCDFNQMLDLRCDHGAPTHIRDFDPETLATRRVVIGQHCYGCTAGAGSSCGGATA